MNIGLDIRPLMSPARSGVGEYTYGLLNAIFEIDKKNQYFLFYNSSKDVSKNIPNWEQDNTRFIQKKWPNKLFNACTKIFNKPKIDKLICHCDKRSDEAIPQTHNQAVGSPRFARDDNKKLDYFFSTNFNFTALSKKTKYILTVHDLSFEFFPGFYSLKQRLWHWATNPKKQCEKATLILTPSENTKRDLMSLYKIPAEKIKVIYPGVNLSQAVIPTKEESMPIKKNSIDPSSSLGDSLGMTTQDKVKQKYNLPIKFILFLGTIEPRKNILGLIEAFEQSYALLPTPYSLVIAGHKGWNDKKIYQKFQSSPYKDRIKFIGSIDPKDKPALYSLASLFVYPSFYEGFGFPIVEAMACGAPVITSNRSSLPEVAGNAAYLVNPNRPSELAGAITEMLKNEKLRDCFRILGLEQAKKFSWEKSARELLEVLD